VTEERMRILEMLSAGKLTTDEADRLLDAVGGSTGVATATKVKSPKFLRVIVDAIDEDNHKPVHINIRVPVLLLRAGVRLASFIPRGAQLKVNDELRKQGMDFDITQIKPENLNEIIDHLGDLQIDIDQPDDVKVRIFAE
jgi:hypothetical protein